MALVPGDGDDDDGYHDGDYDAYEDQDSIVMAY